jgi:hypothetical protein
MKRSCFCASGSGQRRDHQAGVAGDCARCCPSRHSGVFCATSRHFPVRGSARFQSSFPCEAVNRRCDDGGMTSTTRIQKKYDHRLSELVRSTGAVEHAIQLGVPRSTAHGCSHRRRPQVARTRARNPSTLWPSARRIDLSLPPQRKHSGTQSGHLRFATRCGRWQVSPRCPRSASGH